MSNKYYHLVKFNLTPKGLHDYMKPMEYIDTSEERSFRFLLEGNKKAYSGFGLFQIGNTLGFTSTHEDFTYEIKQMCWELAVKYNKQVSAHVLIAYESNYWLLDGIINPSTDIGRLEVKEVGLKENKRLLSIRNKIIELFDEKSRIQHELNDVINNR